MGRAKNTINPAEVSSTPIKVNYPVSYLSYEFQNYGITRNLGTNIAYNVSMSSIDTEEMNNYRLVRQLYYQYYLTGSLLNSASCWDPAWQSTAASGSNDETVYRFPTTSNSNVLVYAIPSRQFGEQIARNSFRIVSASADSPFDIIDDGNGNLIDTAASNTHVGNVFYAQGVVVITNQGYLGVDNLATEVPNIYETENNIPILT